MKKSSNLTLSEHLSAKGTRIGLEAADRDEALLLLAREAEAAGLVPDHRSFLENLKVREAEMSTGVGHGFAVPHAEVAGAKRTFVLGATLARPIEYQSLDQAPVEVMFLIGGKPGEVGLHLQLLARIARLARAPEFKARLRDQKRAEDLIAVIHSAEKSLYAEV